MKNGQILQMMSQWDTHELQALIANVDLDNVFTQAAQTILKERDKPIPESYEEFYLEKEWRK